MYFIDNIIPTEFLENSSFVCIPHTLSSLFNVL